jgi:hypothetical protein
MGFELRNELKMDEIRNEQGGRKAKKEPAQKEFPVPPKPPERQHKRRVPGLSNLENDVLQLLPRIPEEYLTHMARAAKMLRKNGYDFPQLLPGENPEITGNRGREDQPRTPGKKLLTADVLKEAVFEHADHAEVSGLAYENLKKAHEMDQFDENRIPEINKHFDFWSELTSHKLRNEHGKELPPEILKRIASRYYCDKKRLPAMEDVLRNYEVIRKNQEEYERTSKWPRNRKVFGVF